jgi:small subunit ribosomal protein S2
MNTKDSQSGIIDELFKVGAHFGFDKRRRHPSMKPFIFGSKDRVEIFNLEKTQEKLERALSFTEEKASEGATILIVGGKSEAREAVEKAGRDLSMPYVHGRWIGGTLTNFSEIRKRILRLEELTTQKERGELSKYTKKERLLIDREIEKLSNYFGGVSTMKSLPKFLVVVDPRKERIAVAEARVTNIPVIAIAGSDTNIRDLDFPIPANDSSKHTIAYILSEIVGAYKLGVKKSQENKNNDDHDSRN